MHQSKRPYNGSQPSITSYFPASHSTSSSQYSIQAHHEHQRASTPQLPSAVQSSLINVGMRVRKSVPEGYKTGSAYSAFNLFAENTAAAMSNSPSSSPTKPRTRPRAGARELTPFCGIMKVGGMSTQQWGIYNPGGAGDDAYQTSSSEEEDNVPDLSQGSTASDFSGVGIAISPSGCNKRRFFDEEESGTEEFTGMGGSVLGVGRRVLAKPRRKKYSSAGKTTNFAFGAVQDNRVQVIGQDFDFQDAEFLDYGALRADKGAGEVEMSG